MGRAIFLLSTILLVVTACREKTSIEGEVDYFPLAKGDQWVYEGGLSGNFTDTIIYEVAEHMMLRTGVTAWKVIRYWKEPTRSQSDTFFMDRKGEEVMLFFFETDMNPQVVLKYPLEVGQEWSLSGTVSDMSRKSIIKGIETVRVPNGSFRKCITVESKDSVQDSVWRVTHDWYAPNVGRIKSVMEARSDVYEMRLIDYTLHETHRNP